MLEKQALNIGFAHGIDTKTDPKQVQIGKFLKLVNSVFNKAGLLLKRNGYGPLTSLPNEFSVYLTTFNDNLTAVGSSINAYNESNEQWVSRGSIQPLSLSTLPLIRNNLNQTQCDSAIASNGLICTVYTELNNSTSTYKYAIADSVTGQNIVAPVAIPVSSGAISGSARVFVLGEHFVIVFTNTISAVAHLQYIAVNVNTPTNVTANADIASTYIPASTVAWDGVVTNSALYIAWNSTTGGQSIKIAYLNSSLALSAVKSFTASTDKASIMSLCVDNQTPTRPVIYVSFYSASSTNGYTLAVDQALNTVFTPKQIITSLTVLNLASAAQNGVCTVFWEVSNNYSYDSAIPSHFISAVTVTVAGTVGTPYNVVRSVGLASKAFIVDQTIYFLSAYKSPYQPSYFLMNGSTSIQAAPVISAKLAYENGGGYLTLGLPSVTITGESTANVAYLYKDLVEALSTNNNTIQSTTGGIYSQTGINLVKMNINSQYVDSAEIGSDLHLSGGFLWMYDGYLPVEDSFFLWPDSIEATWSASGGSMAAQPDGSTNTNAYYYQVTYEWSDNQGNIFRSAPSIPVAVTTSGSGSSGSITVDVPYLRLTYKTANPVKIVIYRWSVANQVYYQVTSIIAPSLNSTTSDSLAFVDTLADVSIVGNSLYLYYRRSGRRRERAFEGSFDPL